MTPPENASMNIRSVLGLAAASLLTLGLTGTVQAQTPQAGS